ncbi:LacI family DNA-binding transcriptional regulator [Sphingomonas sabuli]|uniref:LacI family DNA-binding transcriptional regulator n=1 Tax=Sphingomonas sabuli TaxID=2764186 RepID=A0A7G9KZT8_9SPHN|nr:LacI family DNA-binding transcriptional regulator [Sphingomonas sabuli]QNM81887.1 LacI family DNA-binding transcriptional regulator [Sphingomonas sabuli]
MANVTIRDVARQAEVSVASVSRVINGGDSVSDAVRDRVNGAISSLGYVPHAGARSLSLARTNAIGVMLPAVHGEFFSEIVRGMDQEASRHGYLLLLSNLPAGSRQAQDALNAMRGRVDGMVMMAPHLDAKELSETLPPRMATVLINSRSQSGAVGAIHIDNAHGATLIVDHLVAQGRRSIVHIAGPHDNVDAQERLAAYRTAIARHGLEPIVVQGDFLIESGGTALAKVLRDGTKFDAVFAANDNMAIGAFEALKAAGISVPSQVAVTGFDDIPLAQHLGITTVRVRISEIGERALSMLFATLAGGGDHEDEYHRPELVIRSTTMEHSA